VLAFCQRRPDSLTRVLLGAKNLPVEPDWFEAEGAPRAQVVVSMPATWKQDAENVELHGHPSTTPCHITALPDGKYKVTGSGARLLIRRQA
jgi:hypothetical protein